ncbi:hypothetical protein GCM10027162_00830 [Streptomyces incanus]
MTRPPALADRGLPCHGPNRYGISTRSLPRSVRPTVSVARPYVLGVTARTGPPRDRRKDFALRPSRLVPWGAIGDTTHGCVIIGTHHLNRARVRKVVHGGVA